MIDESVACKVQSVPWSQTHRSRCESQGRVVLKSIGFHRIVGKGILGRWHSIKMK